MKKVMEVLSLLFVVLISGVSYANMTFSDTYCDEILQIFDKHFKDEASENDAFNFFQDSYDAKTGINGKQLSIVCIKGNLKFDSCQQFIADMGALSIIDSTNNAGKGGAYSFKLIQGASDQNKLNQVINNAKKQGDIAINRYTNNENNVRGFDGKERKYIQIYGKTKAYQLRLTEIYMDGLVGAYTKSNDFYELCFVGGVMRSDCEYVIDSEAPSVAFQNYKTCLESAGKQYCDSVVLNLSDYDIQSLLAEKADCCIEAQKMANNSWNMGVGEKYSLQEFEAAYQAYKNFWMLKECGDLSNKKK